MARHGDDFTRTDPRSFIVQRMANQVNAAIEVQELVLKVVLTDAWWRQPGRTFNKAAAEQTVSDLCALSWKAFFTGSFEAFEHGIRELVRSMDAAQATGPFANVYRWLLARLRENDGWDFPEAVEFLDLCRLFRNAQHNNGRFYPDRGADRAVSWKGKTHSFLVGEVVPDATDALKRAPLVSELFALAASIVRSPSIAELDPIVPPGIRWCSTCEAFHPCRRDSPHECLVCGNVEAA